MEEGQPKKTVFRALGEFYNKCIRVFRVARKPNSFEVKQVSKVSALGILAIGMIGFIIGVIFTLFFL
ncbi:MAG: protein translocase SEC61 complex subunit gamma [Candidatus Pacearchaeota archaeon]|nr:protein translocase SEC61 complex subunit gamma [Candidatus Pacearchaeota archaeon]